MAFKKSCYAFIFLYLITFLQACNRNQTKSINPPEFHDEHKKYISAYTYGLVPRDQTIKIRFTGFVAPEENKGKEITSSILDFEPSISGTLRFADTRTIEFTPDDLLDAGQVYDAKLDLSYFFDTIPSEYEIFPFQFYTIDQNFSVTVNGLEAVNKNELKDQKLTGTLETAAIEKAEEVEKVLRAEADGKDLKITWHHFENGKIHDFEITGIERVEEHFNVKLKWDGSPIGVDKEGEQEIEVPSINTFTFIEARAIDKEEQYIQVTFSDPLDVQQDLNGLIHTSLAQFNFMIEGNIVKAFPQKKLQGNVELVIEPGIKNIIGKKISTQSLVALHFEDVKPAIRAVGNGTIIPRSRGILFPFETVNLSAVDVKITKVYENNILQFLQYNDLDGSSYMYYVGKEILQKKIKLNENQDNNLKVWTRHAIDLSKLIDAEPGAIYQVQIRFRKEYSLYYCDKDSAEQEEKYDEVLLRDGKENLWDYYDNYRYDPKEKYTPCYDLYYHRQYGITKNVLASDMGIIAKKGENGSMLLAITDVKTTEPISGVEVDIFDKQQQKITSAKTDNDGFVRFKPDESPFVAVAKRGSQRGYMRFWNPAISLSKFDVSGNSYQKGVKGFIYTERGVWRPGDSIYVTLLLEDQERALPIDHPILFEMYNPRGQLVDKQVKTKSVGGFYTFPTATGLNDPTGNYNVKINVGGVVFNKNLQVETIIPNRLKIEFEFDHDELSADDQTIGTITSRWLHGAPAQNLSFDITATFRKTKTTFKGYEDYDFNDPLSKYYSESKVIFNGNLDESGQRQIPNNININDNVPGKLRANLLCKVFEPGGNFSTDQFNIDYSPFKNYVGIKTPEGEGEYGVLLTDRTHDIEFALVDNKGNPVKSDELEVSLYKMEWRWWWDYYGDESNYNYTDYNDPDTSAIIAIKNGTGIWKIKVPEQEWGRYLIMANHKGGHRTGKIVYIDNPNWYRRRPENPEGASMLTFTTDKEGYSVGDQVTLNIPTGYEGRALVTLENGREVTKAEWIDAVKGTTTYSFKATADMAPNIYAFVTLIQPHAQTANDLPIRLYGVIPISVDNPQSHLEPEIMMPEVLKPETKVELKISEANKKGMSYTIAMVDEGLLDLTKFKTPSPWDHFFAKIALGVDTWDIYDDILGAYTDGIEKLLSIGGGSGELEPGEGTKVQRFKPMVKFLGPFTLSPGKTNTHTIQLPRYVGSVRTMVIAAENGAYGHAEKTTPVRAPLMVLGTLPRVLGPDEYVSLPVSIFAMEDHVKDVTVSVETNAFLKIQGSATKRISFNKPGEELVTFPIKVDSRLGIAKAHIVARSGNEKAEYDIELQVRAYNPVVTKNQSDILSGGESKRLDYAAFGITGSNSGSLELSAIPALNLEERLGFLIRYPHGCIEQTTSSVFPQVFLTSLVKMSAERQKSIENNIKAGINRIRRFQMPDGGFSYWPYGQWGSESSLWGTNYAGHFLLEAKSKGYNIPLGMLEKWKAFQKLKANTWNDDHNYAELMQAYRLYLLALAGAPEFGAMNRMRERPNLSTSAKWRLAAAYQLAGQSGVADRLSSGLSTDVDDYYELGYTYGSDLRDEAMILETITLLGQFSRGEALMRKISSALRSDKWLSTQTTAYCLIAMSKFAGNALKEGLKISLKLNDNPAEDIEIKQAIYQLPLDLRKQPEGHVEFKNLGSSPLYANLVINGIPKAGEEVSQSNGIILSVRYLNMDGEYIDPTKLYQGTDFIAEITVENTGKYGRLDEVALTDIFPSGWQIHNPRMTGQQFEGETTDPEYMDIRDDRVLYYFDMADPGSYSSYSYSYRSRYESNWKKTFRVGLNASYLGKFYLPGQYVETMYNKDINSLQAGKWVEVVKAGEEGGI